MYEENRRISAYCTWRYPSKKAELANDGIFVRAPHRIGNSILIYGRKNSNFPYQAFVGPDWPCMCVTYSLLIVPTGLFINNIAIQWGPGVVFGATFLLLVTVVFYTFTACSDPGIVLEDEELKLSETESNSKFECGLCNILRPRKASHCFECGFCVLELDHHCPWTGKCIGWKTLKSFYGFLISLCVLIAYVVLLVIITAAMDKPVFDISPKDR